MTKPEWLEVVRQMRAEWPGQAIPDATIAVWYEHVADLPADQVRGAVAAYAREGREFAPTGGMLRKRATELALDVPDWGGVFRALARISGLSTRALVADGDTDRLFTEVGEGLVWRDERAEALAGQSAAVQAFVEHLGWEQIRPVMASDDPNEAVRLREKWREFSAASLRDEGLRGIPAAGLRRLERVSEPKPIGEVLAELEQAR